MSKTNNNRLTSLFSNRTPDDKIMALFLTAGYPDLESTVELVLGFEENGADIIELGMPFSDPLADGPTIQYASNRAIENGITMNRIFEMVRQIRAKSGIPIVLMGYINPILSYGVKEFFREAAAAGVDGLIVPDVTMEESPIIHQPAQTNGISLIYLVAPNTGSERMRRIDGESNGFVYCVSVTGVTGARDGDEVAQSVRRFIDRVNENITRNPKLVGFGIRSHEDATVISREVDGFIVGSALIDEIRTYYPEKGWKERVFQFVKQLKFGDI
ncbi:MAG: tryptophan synthase subunit alpha [Balneolaceae bacterium]